MLETYAQLSRHDHPPPSTEPARVLHRSHHRAHQQLLDIVGELITDGVRTGEIRDDVPPGELAAFCLAALAAADGPVPVAAIRRLVTVTLAGLQAQPGGNTPRSPATT